MRNEKRILKNKAIYKALIIIFTIGILAVGGFSINYWSNSNVVEAVNVVDAMGLMNGENPVNKAINSEKEIIEKKNAEISLRNKRRELNVVEFLKAREERLEEIKKYEEAKANGKIAYLTFDDGPSKVVTPQILDILKEYDVKATFFVIGYMAEKYPDILKMTYDAGHSIGNHTYSHNYGYIYRSPNNFLQDVETANQALKNLLGDEFSTNVVRFPGGSFGDSKNSTKSLLKSKGYNYFDWNSLNGDAEGVNLTKNQLLQRFKQTIKNRDELIVLMHDTDQKVSTVEALPEMIEILLEKGYVFGVLDKYYD